MTDADRTTPSRAPGPRWAPAAFAPYLKAFFGAGVLRGAGGLLMIVSGVVVARLLGKDEFGLYTYVRSWVAILAVVSMLGLRSYMTKEVASCQVRREWASLRGLLEGGQRVAWAAGVVVALVAAGVALLAVRPFWARGGGVWFTALPLVPLMAATGVAIGGLVGLHRVLLGLAGEMLLLPVLSLCVLVAAVTAGAAPTAGTAVGAMLAGATVTYLVIWWMLRRYRPAELGDVAASTSWRRWMGEAAPLLAVSLLMIVNVRADGLMVGTLRGTEQTGVYNMAARLGELVTFPLLSISGVISPSLSRLHTEGRRDALQRLVTRSSRLSLGGALVVAAVLLAAPRWPLGWFGAGFDEGAAALRILVCCQVGSALTGPVGLLLIAIGRGRVTAWALAAGVAVNLTLNALLIPPLGMAGAALATGASVLVWNAVLVVATVRLLGIDPTALGWRRAAR